MVLQVGPVLVLASASTRTWYPLQVPVHLYYVSWPVAARSGACCCPCVLRKGIAALHAILPVAWCTFPSLWNGSSVELYLNFSHGFEQCFITFLGWSVVQTRCYSWNTKSWMRAFHIPFPCLHCNPAALRHFPEPALPKRCIPTPICTQPSYAFRAPYVAMMNMLWFLWTATLETRQAWSQYLDTTERSCFCPSTLRSLIFSDLRNQV
jgi:hypothetical protein